VTPVPPQHGRLDPVIHPVTRLSICGLLAAGAEWVEFAAVRDAIAVSDSVLSKQSRALEDAGYLEVRKGAVGRRPRTWFRLTDAGREAFRAHVAWLTEVAGRAGTAPVASPPGTPGAPRR
jgi:DNA-binding transcriptional ArsR family regulator